jgi:hypothetical protein
MNIRHKVIMYGDSIVLMGIQAGLEVASHSAPQNAGEVNWLPIPEDGAWMVLLFYAPKSEVINLEYDIPGFVRIS